MRLRHAETFLDLARAAAARFQGSAQPLWLDRIGLDHGNLRAALEWSTSTGETEIALGLVGALWRYWLLDGRLHEGQGWVERVFAMPGVDAPTPGRLQAVAAAGSIAYWQGRAAECQRLYEEERDLAARLDDPVMAADAAFNLAGTYVINGDIERGRAAGLDAHRRYEGLGDLRGVNRMEWGFANLTQRTEGPAAALPYFEPILRQSHRTRRRPIRFVGRGEHGLGAVRARRCPGSHRSTPCGHWRAPTVSGTSRAPRSRCRSARSWRSRLDGQPMPSR